VGFYSIRVGHHRPIPNNDEIAEVPSGRNRLLYQMGGSRSPSYHHRRTCEALSGGTSSTDTGSLKSWSQIMESNSTTTHSENFAHNWKSRIITPCSPTLRPTDRLRSRTNPYLKLSRLGSRGQRVYGRKSCQAYYGLTGRRLEHLQERHRFN